MTSFRATFGLTRSIGGWEEGERRERNKRKRQPGRTGAGQRGEWQLNEQREELNVDVEEREENLDVEEREKERERGYSVNSRERSHVLLHGQGCKNGCEKNISGLSQMGGYSQNGAGRGLRGTVVQGCMLYVWLVACGEKHSPSESYFLLFSLEKS